MSDTPRTDEAKDLQRKGLYLLCCTLERELAVMTERFKMMDKNSADNYDCAKKLEEILAAQRTALLKLAERALENGEEWVADAIREIVGHE